MSHSNKKFLEQREIDAMKELSHYQRVQLKLHGNILRENPRNPVFEELGNEEYEQDNDFQNAIFSHLNPEV